MTTKRQRDIRPDCHPDEIAWAAGIIEGEGSFLYHSRCFHITVAQKGHWLPERLKWLFGGSVHRGEKLAFWTLTGPRARGLAKAISPYLSPRRLVQMAKALQP